MATFDGQLADLAISANSAGLLSFIGNFDRLPLNEKVRWGAYVACIAGKCVQSPIHHWLQNAYRTWDIPPPVLGLDPLGQQPYRHLIFHLYPSVSNDLWKWHCKQLRSHWHIFTGRKVIAVAVDSTTHKPQDAISFLPDDAECIVLPNDPILRETLSLPILLTAIRKDSGYVWMAHSKGNSTANDKRGAFLWTKMMYRVLFSEWEEVLENLRDFPCVGTTKIVWNKAKAPYPSGLSTGTWMSAGSFTVWKHSDVFRGNYRKVPIDRYGWEAFPSVIWRDHRLCYSRCQPWPEDEYPTPDPYLSEHYEPSSRVPVVSGSTRDEDCH